MTGLKPAEFWKLTPWEFQQWCDGWEWAREDRGNLQAHFTASLMNCWSKRKVKGRDLFRTKRQKDQDDVYIKARKRRFEEVVRLMGPDAVPVLSTSLERSNSKRHTRME